ncbi:uncharacterized protein LOC128964604 [Oppia nitens]|uniref:uncharacterized protein LOC128964604 n=1 Tax=Oppia nitens TaxID=1686743 RepID=UPI0023D9CEBF|nr:uncharacterized protein LOC128964604 [Oppia nitens]
MAENRRVLTTTCTAFIDDIYNDQQLTGHFNPNDRSVCDRSTTVSIGQTLRNSNQQPVNIHLTDQPQFGNILAVPVEQYSPQPDNRLTPNSDFGNIYDVPVEKLSPQPDGRLSVFSSAYTPSTTPFSVTALAYSPSGTQFTGHSSPNISGPTISFDYRLPINNYPSYQLIGQQSNDSRNYYAMSHEIYNQMPAIRSPFMVDYQSLPYGSVNYTDRSENRLPLLQSNALDSKSQLVNQNNDSITEYLQPLNNDITYNSMSIKNDSNEEIIDISSDNYDEYTYSQTIQSNEQIGEQLSNQSDIEVEDLSNDEINSLMIDQTDLKPRRRSYTLKTQLDALDEIKKHNLNNCEAAAKFGVATKTIRDWKNKEEFLRKAKNERDINIRKRRKMERIRIPKIPEVEEEVLNFLKNQRKKSAIVTGSDLRSKAMIIYQQLKRKGIIRPVMDKKTGREFSASNGWLSNFNKRNRISWRAKTSVGQKIPEDAREKSYTFFSRVDSWRADDHKNIGVIYNADEIPMYIDIPGNYTFTEKGAKTVKVKTTGHEKTRYTLILCADNTGRKLKPAIIFRNRVKIPKGCSPKELTGVHVMVSKSGSIDRHLMIDWITNVYDARGDAIFHRQHDRSVGEFRKNLFVMDSALAHTRDEIKDHFYNKCDTKVMIIQGGMTPLLQPADVSWNRPIKAKISAKWREWMDLEKTTEDRTKKGNLRPPSHRLIAEWCRDAWKELPSDAIKRSFNECNLGQQRNDYLLHSKLVTILNTTENTECIDDNISDPTGLSDNEDIVTKEYTYEIDSDTGGDDIINVSQDNIDVNSSEDELYKNCWL